MPTPTTIAPLENPTGNGLINNPNSLTANQNASTANQNALPPPTIIPPVANYTPAIGTAGQATSTGFTPTPYAVPENGLVQNRVLSLVGQDSPLMQQARTRALQEKNSRGLVNSSLAITAGQDAVIGQALPIAQADANAINTASLKTSEAHNVASQFGANAANVASSTNSQLENAMNTTNANAKNAALNVEAQATNQRSLANIDTNSKQSLAVLQSQNQLLLQTNVNAANMFSQVVKAISDIATNTTLDAAAKQAATNSQLNLLNEGLRATVTISSTDQAAINALNLGQFFNTTAPNTGATGSTTPPPAGGTRPPVNSGNGNFVNTPTPPLTPAQIAQQTAQQAAQQAATWRQGLPVPNGYRVDTVPGRGQDATMYILRKI